MSAWISSSNVSALLESLYADAEANDHLVRHGVRDAGMPTREQGAYHGMRFAYMAINREFGRLLYSLVRRSPGGAVAEFGTSFGVSTIYLASAVRDNGGGKVITTELEPEKSEQAQRNLAAAGLQDWVEFRVGDARDALQLLPADSVGMVFLDGAKPLYFEVLKLLEPALKRGAIIASDNTDHSGLEDFLAYLREPANGYISSAIRTRDGEKMGSHEISYRL